MRLKQELKSQNYAFHSNNQPLTYFATGANIEAVMSICGNYLEYLNAQQRVALGHGCFALILNRSLPDLAVDTRVLIALPAELGEALEQLTPAELACVCECILHNTKPDAFD